MLLEALVVVSVHTKSGSNVTLLNTWTVVLKLATRTRPPFCHNSGGHGFWQVVWILSPGQLARIEGHSNRCGGARLLQASIFTEDGRLLGCPRGRFMDLYRAISTPPQKCSTAACLHAISKAQQARPQPCPEPKAHVQLKPELCAFDCDSHRSHHDAELWERLRGLVRGKVRRMPVGQLFTTQPTCMGAPHCRALPPGQADRVPKRLERSPGRSEGVVTSGNDEKTPHDHQTAQ